jgi:Holliday junction resolvase RusA-like endonuclease
MKAQFTIPGKPFAWRRARSNGKVRFNDPAMEAHANVVQAIALKHFPEPIEGAVRLEIRALFAVPKSYSAKKRAETIWRAHTSKPDGDNLAKQIGDALNRIAWLDDSQIADARVIKTWGDRDETVVLIEKMGGEE